MPQDLFLNYADAKSLNNESIADLIIICLQEVDRSASGNNEVFNAWKTCFQRLDNYQMKFQEKVAGTALIILSKQDIQIIGQKQLKLGGCKGAIGVSFELWSSSFLIVGSHLAHDVSKNEQRNKQFKIIESQMQFDYSKDLITQLELGGKRTARSHDFVFWLGDLNYRLDCSIEGQQLQPQMFDYSALKQYDQLSQAIESQSAFQGYCEAKIIFPPTYKFKSENVYDCARTPSWCDRILFLEPKVDDSVQVSDVIEVVDISEDETEPQASALLVRLDELQRQATDLRQSNPHRTENVAPVAYFSGEDYTFSDHRPVFGVFQVQCRQIDVSKYSQLQSVIQAEYDAVVREHVPAFLVETKQIDFSQVLLHREAVCLIEVLVQPGHCVSVRQPDSIRQYVKAKEVSRSPVNDRELVAVQLRLGLTERFVHARGFSAFADRLNVYQVAVVATTVFHDRALSSEQLVPLTFSLQMSPLGITLEQLTCWPAEALVLNQDGTAVLVGEMSASLTESDCVIPRVIGRLVATISNNFGVVAAIPALSEMVFLHKLIRALPKPLLAENYQKLFRQAKTSADFANIMAVLAVQNTLEQRVFSRVLEVFVEIRGRAKVQQLADETAFVREMGEEFAATLLGDAGAAKVLALAETGFWV